MPLTTEQKRQILISKGLSPDDYDLEASAPAPAPSTSGLPYQPVGPNLLAPVLPKPQQPIVPPAVADPSNAPAGVTTTSGALASHAAAGLLPTAAALATGAGIAAAPFTAGLSAIPALALGLGGAAVAGAGTSYLQSKLLPKSATDYLAAGEHEHPVASMVGELAPNALAFNPLKSVAQLPNVAKGAGRLLFGQGVLPTVEKQALQNALINVGGNVGIDAAQQIAGGQEYDPVRSLEAAGQGLLFSEPTRLGTKVFGFHPVVDLPSREGRQLPAVRPPFENEPIPLKTMGSNPGIEGPYKENAPLKWKGQPEPPDIATFENEGGQVAKEEVTPLQIEKQRAAELDAKEATIQKAVNDKREAALTEQEQELLKQQEEQRPEFQKESSLPPPTQQDLVAEQLRRAHKAGIDTQENYNLKNAEGQPVHGQYEVDRRLASISTNKAKPAAEDTISHEVWHGRIKDWQNSADPVDRKMAAELLKAYGGDEEKLVTALGEGEHGRIVNRLSNPTLKFKLKQHLSDYGARLKRGLLGNKEVPTLLQHAQARAEAEPTYGRRAELLPEFGAGKSISAVPKNQEDSNLKEAPVKFAHHWEGIGDMYNMTEDAHPNLVKGSTVTEKTLNKYGFKVPESERPKNQEESSLPFITDTERYLKQDRPFGLTPSSRGTLPTQSLEARLRRAIPKDEMAALNEGGLKEFLQGKMHVNIGELQKWIKENGPKVEVRTASKDYTKSEEGIYAEHAKITHELDTKYPGWDSTDPSESDYKVDKNFADLLKKLSDANKKIEQMENEGEANRPRWSSIAPKAEKDMPGYVEIAVVRPHGNIKGKPILGLTPSNDKYLNDNGVKFGESHNFPPNTVGWVRGYMDGDTFRIIEVQSDWATHIKNMENTKDRSYWTAETQDERERHLQSSIAYTKAKDPTLPYYESLALKAAIRHAVEQGARNISIDDSQTAMLTEGHDRVASTNIELFDKLMKEKFPFFEYEGDAIKKAKSTYDIHNGAYTSDYVHEMQDGGFVVASPIEMHQIEKSIPKIIEQQKGMEQHYDQNLPNILRKLTGDKGTLKEFGEHKMAVEKVSSYTDTRQPFLIVDTRNDATIHTTATRQEAEQFIANHPRKDTLEIDSAYRPRKDLIFKNPNGTPKTQSTSRTFSLENLAPRVSAGEPNSIFSGSRYQHESTLPSILPFLTSENNRPAQAIGTEQAKELSLALNKNSAEKAFISDRLGQALIHPVSKLSRRELDELYRYRYDKDQGVEPSITLNARQQKANEEISRAFTDFRHYANKIGPMIRQGERIRLGGVNENYHPNILDPDVRNLWLEKPASPEAKQYEKMYTDYLESKGVDAKEAQETFDNYIKGLGANRSRPSTELEFGATRKAEGLGLPWELVDKNYNRASLSYARRAGSDVAFFKYIQKDPNVLKMLGLKDQMGNDPTSEYEFIGNHPSVQKAVNSMLGFRDSSINPIFASATRAVGSSVMGIGTALRNVVQAPSAALAHAGYSQVIKSLALDGEKMEKAIKAGAVKAKFSDLDVLDPDSYTTGITKTITRMLDSYSELMRKWQGRDLSDKLEAAYHYNIGEDLAKQWFASGNKRMLDLHGLNVDNLEAKINGTEAVTPEDIQKIARNVTDAGRGTYDSRGLPSWAMHGQLAPFFALSRWSIEKSNTITRDVLRPMTEGNFTPFLRYTLGAALSGVAIEKLNEVLSGKRGEDPTIKEVGEYGSSEDKIAKAIGILQLGSYAGILSDSAKLAMRTIQGKDITYSNPVSLPLYTWATDTIGRNLTDAAAAIKDGEDRMEVAGKLVTSILAQSVQTARYIKAYSSPEDTGRKEKYRDLRVFNEMVEDKSPTSSVDRPNEFEGIKAKEFKRTDDLEEALKLVPELLSKAMEKANGDPYKLSSELKKLKNNSYQTMPSPETFPVSFSRYLTYLESTQGKEKASEVLTDYLRRSEINKIKSSVIPSL